MSEQFDQLFNVEITVTRTELDLKISALCREATTYKDVDWDKAVACLQEAKALMKKSKVVRGIETWTRLPVFLQQAGRFNEAIKEFKWLLKTVGSRRKKEFKHIEYPTFFECYTHLDHSVIYDKMRMVCKREKRDEDMKKYQALCEQHRFLYEELKPIVEKERIEHSEVLAQKRELWRNRSK
jgi:tetratricopeptide (TPR) repeat protein